MTGIVGVARGIRVNKTHKAPALMELKFLCAKTDNGLIGKISDGDNCYEITKTEIVIER